MGLQLTDGGGPHQLGVSKQADGRGRTFGLSKLSVLQSQVRVPRDGRGPVKVRLATGVGQVM